MHETQSSAAIGFEIPKLTDSEFTQIAVMVREQTGIDLRAGKEQLVVSRLSRLVRQSGSKSFTEYLKRIQGDSGGKMRVDLADALTTNHTSFMREPAHFRFLVEQVFGSWKATESLSIWSSACSSGEEPYSIVCSLLDAPVAGMRPAFQVLASDISTRMLAEAQAGVYAERKCASLPASWRQKYFQTSKALQPGTLQVTAAVRNQVRFQQINLTSMPSVGTFHVIFCRNVLIYFDRPIQEKIVNGLASQLIPGGYLLVGHAEGLASLNHQLQYVQPAVYRKPANGKR